MVFAVSEAFFGYRDDLLGKLGGGGEGKWTFLVREDGLKMKVQIALMVIETGLLSVSYPGAQSKDAQWRLPESVQI